MAMGPGKYDDLATYVREQAQATGVIVIVVGGNKGAGFAQQWMARESDMPGMLRTQASALRQVAKQMDLDASEAEAKS